MSTFIRFEIKPGKEPCLTTLLNYILQGEHWRRIAVLVNDFGTINMDAEQALSLPDAEAKLARAQVVGGDLVVGCLR